MDSAYIESKDAVDDAISYLEIARDKMSDLWDEQLFTGPRTDGNKADRIREEAEENLIEAMHRITIAMFHTSRHFV